MKTRYIFFLFAWISFTVLAAPPDVGFNIDLATPAQKFSYTTFAGNTPAIPVTILTNGEAYLGFAGYTPQLNYMINDQASSLKTIAGTLSGNIATFQGLTNSFPAHGTYFAEVFFQSGATKITAGQGILYVNRSPSSGSYGGLNLSPRINWDIVTNIGSPPWIALTEPVFLASVAYNITAAMTNGWQTNFYRVQTNLDLASNALSAAVGLVQTNFNNGSNDLRAAIGLVQTNFNNGSNTLYAAITNQQHNIDLSSNSAYLVHTAFVGQVDIATNDMLAQLTAVRTNQIATNSLFQLICDALSSSNSLFQGFFTAQVSTNMGFQNLFTNLAGTNGLFQTIINALASTNSLFQGLFDAQLSTNAGFQAFDTAQIDTNANYEIRITAVTTGKADLATYSSHTAAQGNTNSLFQTILDYLSSSNLLFQGLFDSQSDTNAGFQAAITNVQNTNTAQNLRITAVEGYTNAAQVSYSWGAHSNAGYLTAGTNRFNEVFAADLSLVGTNIANLTQATYTGVVTTVAYTGVTMLVQWGTYAWGFTKQNAYGTSTLSIGVSSISRTAAGAYSNYFVCSGTDSNLVLRLDGDGTSKSDVSALYVCPVTGGNVNVAGNLNVGGTMRIGGAVLTNAAAHIAETASAHGGTLTNWLTTVYSNALTTVSNTAVGGSNLAMTAQGMAAGISNDLNAVTNALHTAITAEVARATGAEVGISNAFIAADGQVSNSFIAADAGISNSLWALGTGITNAFEAADGGISNTLATKLDLAGGVMTGPVTGTTIKVDSVALGTNPPISDWPASGGLTNETDPVWGVASNAVVYTNDATYTDTVAKAAAALPTSGGVLTGPVTSTAPITAALFTGDGSGLTNTPAGNLSGWSGTPATQNVDHASHFVWFKEFSGVITTNSTMLFASQVPGDLLPATVVGVYTQTPDLIEEKTSWSSTNGWWIFHKLASAGYCIGTAAQTPYFAVSSLTEPAGQYSQMPEMSTGFVQVVHDVTITTNCVSWLVGLDTNNNSLVINRDGTNLFYISPTGVASQVLLDMGTNSFVLGGEARTNWPTSMAFGTSDSTAYRGDQGAAVSNIAAGALPKAGGTMTGEIFLGTNRIYFGSATTDPWVAGLGTTNIQFGAGTNRAIFGSPW